MRDMRFEIDSQIPYLNFQFTTFTISGDLDRGFREWRFSSHISYLASQIYYQTNNKQKI